jgi:hypothetical protein
MDFTCDLHLCDIEEPRIECHAMANYKERDIHVLRIGPATIYLVDDQLTAIAGVIAQYQFERAETVVPAAPAARAGRNPKGDDAGASPPACARAAAADVPPACPDCGAPMTAVNPGWRCLACGNYEPPMMAPDRRAGSQIDVDGLFTRMAHGFGSRREAWEAE